MPAIPTPCTTSGCCSLTGGSRRDLEEARRWLQQAADAGHTDAIYNFGILLAYRWEPPDLEEARRWLQQAADAGHTDAAALLATLPPWSEGVS